MVDEVGAPTAALARPADSTSVSSLRAPPTSAQLSAPAVPTTPLEPFNPDPGRSGRTLHGFLITLAVLAVTAVVGITALMLHKANTTTYPVEDLVGLEVGEARNRIATNGWEVSEVREKNDDQPLGHRVQDRSQLG